MIISHPWYYVIQRIHKLQSLVYIQFTYNLSGRWKGNVTEIQQNYA